MAAEEKSELILAFPTVLLLLIGLTVFTGVAMYLLPANLSSASIGTAAAMTPDDSVLLRAYTTMSTAKAAAAPVKNVSFPVATLIHDYVDRYPKNRQHVNAKDRNAETSLDLSTELNSLARAKGSRAANDLAVKRITWSEFSPLATVFPRDAVSRATYKEEQSIWVGGSNQYQTSNDRLEGRLNNFAYTVRFTKDEFGIPVCTNASVPDNYYAWCTGSNPSATSLHRVSIRFLGDNWIITGMAPPLGGNVTTVSRVATGGSVKLAKESKYFVLSTGQAIYAGSIKLVLVKVLPGGTGVNNPVVFQVTGPNNKTAGNITVPVGSTYKVSVGNETQLIFVYATGSRTAAVGVLSQEMTLSSWQSWQQNTSSRYVTYLAWKNKNLPAYCGSGSTCAKADMVDTLREITIFYDQTESGMRPGESVSLVGNPDVFRFVFNGSDLKESEKDGLALTVVTNPGLTVAVLPNTPVEGNTNAVVTSCSKTKILDRTLISLRSSSSNFRLVGRSENINPVYLDPTTGVLYALLSRNATCYAAFGRKAFIADGTRTFVSYPLSGSSIRGAPAGILSGAIEFVSGQPSNKAFGAGNSIMVNIYETGGNINNTMNSMSKMSFNITGANGFNNSVRILQNTSDSFGWTLNTILYSINPSTDVPTITSNPEAPYITIRGSEFTGMSADSATFKIAKRVANVNWVLVGKAN